MSVESESSITPDVIDDIHLHDIDKWKPMELFMQSGVQDSGLLDDRKKLPPVEVYESFYTAPGTTIMDKVYTNRVRIGKGTFGTVFKAQHRETLEYVAIKQVQFSNDKEGIPIIALREIGILYRYPHDNIVQLKEIATSSEESYESGKGAVFLIFEYMDHDLTALIDEHWKEFSVIQIKSYMKQLLKGVAFCHKKNILHRDIKGSNLLVDKNGVLKLADFGLARLIPFGNRANHLTNRVVTLWYRPPELLLGSTSYSKAVDMFSVGCILAELLRGKALFQGTSEVEQIELVFKLLGTPKEEGWEDAKKLDFYSMLEPKNPIKKSLRDTFIGKYVTDESLDLLDKLLVINPTERLSAKQALKHPFFRNAPTASLVPLISYKSCHELATKELRKKRQQRPIDSAEFSPPSKIAKLDNDHPPSRVPRKRVFRPVKMKNSDYSVPIPSQTPTSNSPQQPLPPSHYIENGGYRNFKTNYRGRRGRGYWNPNYSRGSPPHYNNNNNNNKHSSSYNPSWRGSREGSYDYSRSYQEHPSWEQDHPQPPPSYEYDQLPKHLSHPRDPRHESNTPSWHRNP